MDRSLIGFLELFIVLAFVIGWGVLELVALRMDKRRREQAERSEHEGDPPA